MFIAGKIFTRYFLGASVLELLSKSLSDTSRIAKKISGMITAGQVICLTGDLGAGKTTFTKTLLAEIGVSEIVSSPTFTIAKEYMLDKGTIYHMDLYRVESEDELIEIGLSEMIDNAYLTVIEWPEVARYMLDKENVINIEITFNADGDRVFNINGGKE